MKFFSQHKEEKIRNSMTQFIRKKAGVDGVYGQNPIEWQHFLSKSEINDVVKDSEQTYRNVFFTYHSRYLERTGTKIVH